MAKTKAKTTKKKAVSTKLSISSIWGEGWKQFKSKPGSIYLLLVGMIAISIFISLVLDPVAKSVGGDFLMWIVSQLVSIIVGLGFMRALLQVFRNKDIDVSFIWENPKIIWEYVLATLAVSAVIILGFIALILPGIYAAARLMFVPYLIADKELSAKEAWKKSMEMTKGRLGIIILFWLSTFAVNILGVMALIVGLFVTLPLTMMAQVVFYEKLLKAK